MQIITLFGFRIFITLFKKSSFHEFISIICFGNCTSRSIDISSFQSLDGKFIQHGHLLDFIIRLYIVVLPNQVAACTSISLFHWAIATSILSKHSDWAFNQAAKFGTFIFPMILSESEWFILDIYILKINIKFTYYIYVIYICQDIIYYKSSNHISIVASFSDNSTDDFLVNFSDKYLCISIDGLEEIAVDKLTSWNGTAGNITL